MPSPADFTYETGSGYTLVWNGVHWEQTPPPAPAPEPTLPASELAAELDLLKHA